jgi:hypothetical protein
MLYLPPARAYRTFIRFIPGFRLKDGHAAKEDEGPIPFEISWTPLQSQPFAFVRAI